MNNKHWSKVQLLHEVVTNPNIIIKGQHSYYSDCWDMGFEGMILKNNIIHKQKAYVP